MTHILVTGGAGFIGSNFIHYLTRTHPDWRITNLDKLTYAGNLANLEGLKTHPGYRFVKADICDRAAVEPLVAEADIVANFAAETHVDRSIHDAGQFILTDVYGTFVLLEAVRLESRSQLFVQISTDEVYGVLAPDRLARKIRWIHGILIPQARPGRIVSLTPTSRHTGFR